MSDDRRFNTLILYMSFALTILVILVHAFNVEYAGNLLTGISFFTGYDPLPVPEEADLVFFFARIENLFSETLGQAAVPGFFMISAYLFYRNIGKRLTFPVLRKKWASRIRSLLIPYLLWNLFYFLVNFAADRGGIELSFKTVFSAVVNYSYNPVFWYMKQLILLTVFAPFIHELLKKRYAGAFFLAGSFAAAAVWARLPYHIINEDSLFYYMTGAYLSLHLKTEVEKRRGAGELFIKGAVFFAAAFFLQAINFDIQSPQGALFCTGILPDEYKAELITGLTVLCRAIMPMGIFCVISALQELYSRKCGSELPVFGFMKINFFVYATHYLIIRAVNKTAELLAPEFFRDYVFFSLYFLMPVICIFSAYWVSFFLKRHFPGFWSVINGGR